LVCYKYSKNWGYRENCYICGMKKQELFNLPEEGAELIRLYDEIKNTDDSQFVNPASKKERLLGMVDELHAALQQVDDGNASFDYVAHIASDLLAQCNAKEAKVRYDKTKDQMLGEIVAKLRPIVTDALLGKNVCVKGGPDNFQYFKVYEVIVKRYAFNELCILFKGLGFEIWPKAFNCKGNAFPTFGAKSGHGVRLVLTGKDPFADEWLYVLSDEEMTRVFRTTIDDMAKTMEIPGY